MDSGGGSEGTGIRDERVRPDDRPREERFQPPALFQGEQDLLEGPFLQDI